MSMEQWKADRLMKKAKKGARKALEKQGHHRGEETEISQKS